MGRALNNFLLPSGESLPNKKHGTQPKIEDFVDTNNVQPTKSGDLFEKITCACQQFFSKNQIKWMYKEPKLLYT